MLGPYLHIILWITGGITALMIFQFLVPKWYLKNILNVEVTEEPGRFFTGHWGVMVFCLGVLLIWAGFDEALRKPVMLMAAIEKAVLVIWVIKDRKKPYTKKMIPAAIFDTLCVSIYSTFLITG